jgi:hypothetical protein
VRTKPGILDSATRALSLVLGFYFFSCAVSREAVLPPASLPPTRVGEGQAQRKGPYSATNQIAQGTLIIPTKMLNFGVVERKRAEVREGPGVQFALKEKVLLEGDRVILFERVGVWRRVLSQRREVKGWVHFRALKPSNAALEDQITLPSDDLPTVIAIKPVRLATTFATDKIIEVSIPKGTMFRSLTHRNSKVLVYLLPTKSVIWLDGKDVK